MKCDSCEDPILFLTNTMPNPVLHRHSTNCLDKAARGRVGGYRPSNSSNSMLDSSQNELSLSDLTLTRPIRKRSGAGSKLMEDTSSKTATTVNESYNHSSSFGCSFSQRSSTARGNSRNFMSSGALDTSQYLDNPSSRRGFGEGETTDDGSMADSSLSSISSGMSSSSRLRNLKGIRRRRSDPVTRRWREQCSKLYKEHVLDTCPEQQSVLAATTTAAVTKIQSCVRRFLLQKSNTTTKK